MLLATPWNARSVALFSWQLTQVRLDTAAWPATDSVGVLAILKPFATKLEAWQAVQAALEIGMCVDSCVTSDGTPYQAAPVLWQLAQLTEDTAACPAAASDGVVVIANPPTVKVDAWQVLQSPVPSAMWLAAPLVPTVPGAALAVVPSQATSPGVEPERWQVAHARLDTAACPAAVSAGVAVILKPACD